MTKRILRALGETDERYFLAYAESIKKKDPKKIVMRRWAAAAAAMLIFVSTICFFLQIQHHIFTKKGFVRFDYLSFEDMMDAESRPADGYGSGIPYETRLSSLDFNSFDNVHYFICYEESKNQDFTMAMSTPFTYVCEGTKEGIQYEIAYHASADLTGLPKRFHPTRNHKKKVFVAEHMVYFLTHWNRSEGEFVDETGYYKIICYSKNTDDLFAVLKDLFDIY